MLQTFFSLWCQGISPDELKDELPERQPRYPFLSGLEKVLFVTRILFMNPFVKLPKDILYAMKTEWGTVGRRREQ